jgi:hypothetical protein
LALVALEVRHPLALLLTVHQGQVLYFQPLHLLAAATAVLMLLALLAVPAGVAETGLLVVALVVLVTLLLYFLLRDQTAGQGLVLTVALAVAAALQVRAETVLKVAARAAPVRRLALLDRL